MRIALLGSALSAGGADPGCRHAPREFLRHEYRRLKPRLGRPVRWAGVVRERGHIGRPWPAGLPLVADSVRRLAWRVARIRAGGELPVVIGGDHTGAIGTWSGVAMGRGKPIGLLWIDAHLDSHTPETSETGRLHGMPLAALLGEGDPALTGIAGFTPVVDPRYCAIVGVRSFEAGEPPRLNRLGVRFYRRTEVFRRGLTEVVDEAWARVSACPNGFGVSLDLDVLDPLLAPGVSVPEERGVDPHQLILALSYQGRKHRLRGVEVVELNPNLDYRGRTRKLISKLLEALLNQRS